MRRLLLRAVNPLVRGVLRSPLHVLLSRTLLLITYTGRRSGRRHTIPAGYAEAEGDLVVLVGWADEKVWWRNVRGGRPVTVRLRGRLLEGVADVVSGEAAAEAALGAYLRKFPATARRRGIPVDERGRPDAAGVREAARGEVLVRVTLHPGT